MVPQEKNSRNYAFLAIKYRDRIFANLTTQMKVLKSPFKITNTHNRPTRQTLHMLYFTPGTILSPTRHGVIG